MVYFMSTTTGTFIDPLECLIKQLNETILLIHLRGNCICSKMRFLLILKWIRKNYFSRSSGWIVLKNFNLINNFLLIHFWSYTDIEFWSTFNFIKTLFLVQIKWFAIGWKYSLNSKIGHKRKTETKNSRWLFARWKTGILLISLLKLGELLVLFISECLFTLVLS